MESDSSVPGAEVPGEPIDNGKRFKKVALKQPAS